jgi:hypothetical protein
MTGGAASKHLKDARGWNRESAHTGTTANIWLHRAEGRDKKREGERERGREGERERGSEGKRERGREEERKKGRKRRKRRKREGERNMEKERERERGYLRSNNPVHLTSLKNQMLGKMPQARVLT